MTSFAAKSYSNADVIEVQTNTIRGIDVLVNGEVVDFEMSISNKLFVRGKKYLRLVLCHLYASVQGQVII